MRVCFSLGTSTRSLARSTLAFATVTALLLSGCAGVPPSESGRVAPVATDGPFKIEGRLSARRGSEGMTANFTWTHSPPRDELVVTTPLGQDVAQIRGDVTAQRVELRTGDGGHDEAPDWSTLTERALGFALPVAGLGAWVRGAPHAGAPFSTEPDARGRAKVLRQDGWEIVYEYGDDTTRTPSRLRLSYAGLEVRIVIDRWE